MFVIVVDETEYDDKELYQSAMKTEEFPATNASRFTVLLKLNRVNLSKDFSESDQCSRYHCNCKQSNFYV